MEYGSCLFRVAAAARIEEQRLEVASIHNREFARPAVSRNPIRSGPLSGSACFDQTGDSVVFDFQDKHLVILDTGALNHRVCRGPCIHVVCTPEERPYEVIERRLSHRPV